MNLRETRARRALAASWALISILFGSAAAADRVAAPPSTETEQLLARERTRSAVVEALELYQKPVTTGIEANDNLVEAVDRLAGFGEDAVPFLTIELAQQSPESYRFCAYALGRLATAESKRALEAEIERNDVDGSDIAIVRKAWAAWALALQGHVAAVDRFDAGRNRSSQVAMHLETSAFEAAAILTAPASAARLVAQLEALNLQATESHDADRARLWRLRALRRVADPATAPTIIPLLADPERSVRFEAAHALGSIGTEPGTHALQRALEDPQPPVRRIAALSLAEISSPASLPTVQARLEVEDDAVTRGALYLALAKISGTAALPLLARHRARPDPVERRAHVDALLAIGPPATSALADALTDPAAAVSVRAANHLGTLQARAALLAALPSLASPTLEVAVDQLVSLDERGAGAVLSERLASQSLRATVTDPVQRALIERCCRALVDLAHVTAIPVLREALPRQTDASLIEILGRTIRRLELIERLGDDTTAWIEASMDGDLDARARAWNRLVELATPDAIRSLTDRFASVERADRLEILRAIGRRRLAAASTIVGQVLKDPRFDPAPEAALRETAAWAAWRIGGREMTRALSQAVERRVGRDARVAVYFALVAGRDALPVLAAVRAPRFRYLLWTRGREQELLDSLGRDIAAGRRPWALEVPPEGIPLL